MMLRSRNLGLAARGQRRSTRLITAISKASLAPCSSSSPSLSTLPHYSNSGSSSLPLASSPRLQRLPTDSACVQWRRTYATRSPKSAPSAPPKSIAIIGGGLTGLTTAFYMRKCNPDAKITLYEKSDRLGGWIDTEKMAVKTPDGKEGVVHFERGARLVKALPRKSFQNLDAMLFYDLIFKLSLLDGVRFVGTETYLGRYVYYPDHLVELGIRPASYFVKSPLRYIGHLVSQIGSLFTEPVFKDLFPSLWSWYKTRMPPAEEVDQSVGDYLAGRFGSRSLVDNIMSAMMHGIYGGDVWKLSVDSSPLRSRMRREPYLEARRQKAKVMPTSGSDIDLLYTLFDDNMFLTIVWADGFAGPREDCSWIWFRDGFGTLTDGLAEALRNGMNVDIKLNQSIDSLAYQPDRGTVALTTEKGDQAVQYDKVISTIYAGDLSALVKPGLLPTLKEIKAVSIQAVNLWYPTPGLNRPHHGFGYLIPQSVPFDQNPEGALGVLFDSDRDYTFKPELVSSGKAPADFDLGADTVPGTKFTVLLGGHLMEGMELPTGEKAIDMAKSVLERHLGIPKEESARAVGSTKTCRNCIPQHLVGHRQRMIELDAELMGSFHGRLAAIGPSYHLPGVLPSIRAAWDISKEVAREFGADEELLSPERSEQAKERLVEFGPILPTGLGRIAYPNPSLYFDEHTAKNTLQRVDDIRAHFEKTQQEEESGSRHE